MAALNRLAHVRVGEELASLRAATGAGMLQSLRARAATLPTVVTKGNSLIAQVNGGREIGIQTASVAYLSDDRKLLLPKYLLDEPIAYVALDRAAEYHQGMVAYQTLLANFGQGDLTNGLVVPDMVHTDLANVDAYDWPGLLPTWVEHAIDETRALALSYNFIVGSFADDGTFTARSAALESAFAYFICNTTGDEADLFAIAWLLEAGEASPVNVNALFAIPEFRQNLSDRICMMRDINCSVCDHGALRNARMRWSDADCLHTPEEIRFRPKLSPLTMSMIAGLNLAAVGNNPILAWTRSYGTSAGLVPQNPPASKHQIEYQVTYECPEDAELRIVSDAHPTGDKGRAFQRGCLSVIAGFGMLHLANDHTWKGSDATLKRKALVMIECLRTIFDTAAIDLLKSDAFAEHAARTAAHCFGLSATWTTFKAGRRHMFIAEPLLDRDSVVPPPVAKVGLVCAMMDKIMALPFGDAVKKRYKERYDAFVAVRTRVVADAPAYSLLHKHYGIPDIMTLTEEQEDALDGVMPFCAAYALTFEKDSEGKPIGAALSPIIQKLSNNALVDMYAQAFLAFVEKGADIASMMATADSSSTP